MTEDYLVMRLRLMRSSSNRRIYHAWLHTQAADRIEADAKRITTIRAETIEECARVAEGHRGAALKNQAKHSVGRLSNYSEELQAELRAEERGEDIASEIIAKAIRALGKDKSGE